MQRIVLKDDVTECKSGYPYDLRWLDRDAFELRFTSPVTILIGEDGTGKSTLVEAIAALSGYDEAGGGKGYRPVPRTPSSTAPSPNRRQSLSPMLFAKRSRNSPAQHSRCIFAFRSQYISRELRDETHPAASLVDAMVRENLMSAFMFPTTKNLHSRRTAPFRPSCGFLRTQP